jgi:5-methylcytosine-specific restriction enzyme A
MGAEAWAHFYKKRSWERRRRFQLREHPWCAFCEQRGVATVATVADHVEPHKGDWNLFRFGALQSLCAPCHSSGKQFLELRGYRTDVGDDGWPTDPRHPANKVR